MTRFQTNNNKKEILPVFSIFVFGKNVSLKKHKNAVGEFITYVITVKLSMQIFENSTLQSYWKEPYNYSAKPHQHFFLKQSLVTRRRKRLIDFFLNVLIIKQEIGSFYTVVYFKKMLNDRILNNKIYDKKNTVNHFLT